MNVVSFFSGCGGLDLGFKQAGFSVLWANDIEKSVQKTFEYNHPGTQFVLADLNTILPEDIPSCDGFIGGPPCQSWSVAGEQKGLEDRRGQLFLTYINLIKSKQPKFFLIENVKGILDDKFKCVFNQFIYDLSQAGYDVKWELVDAFDFGIPQNRNRVFIIGFKKDLKSEFVFPKPNPSKKINQQSAFSDIITMPAKYSKHDLVKENAELANHDVIIDPFGSYYTKGNRRRSWFSPSFTIHATAENIPLHPSSPKMLYNSHASWSFQKDASNPYRRLSVRECARVQSFPDDFRFFYDRISEGYKMIGNAVPPLLAKVLALAIRDSLVHNKIYEQEQQTTSQDESTDIVLVGYYKGNVHYSKILEKKIYYVRSDERFGSVFKDDCLIPKYLLLHYKNEASVLELTGEEPYVVAASYLRSLGFQVSGNYYLCFDIRDITPLSLKNHDGVISQQLNYDKKTFSPYFTTVNEVVK